MKKYKKRYKVRFTYDLVFQDDEVRTYEIFDFDTEEEWRKYYDNADEYFLNIVDREVRHNEECHMGLNYCELLYVEVYELINNKYECIAYDYSRKSDGIIN